jgi:hypothetical protein
MTDTQTTYGKTQKKLHESPVDLVIRADLCRHEAGVYSAVDRGVYVFSYQLGEGKTCRKNLRFIH